MPSKEKETKEKEVISGATNQHKSIEKKGEYGVHSGIKEK